MPRTFLAVTTAVTFAMPAFAQTAGIDATVRDALTSNGYEASIVAGLSDVQKAEIYLLATSEDRFDVRRALQGYELDVAAAAGVTPDITAVVAEALESNGYAAEVVSLLTGTEIAEIYVLATSEDAQAVTAAISALEFPMAEEMAEMGPAPEPGTTLDRVVADYLERADYDADVIAALSDQQRADIFFLISSSEQASVRDDIDAIINS